MRAEQLVSRQLFDPNSTICDPNVPNVTVILMRAESVVLACGIYRMRPEILEEEYDIFTSSEVELQQ